MNVTLLRLARRDRNGVRSWIVPGSFNVAKLLPAARSTWGVPAFYWPDLDPRDGSQMTRGVRLDWHRGIARRAALGLVGRA